MLHLHHHQMCNLGHYSALIREGAKGIISTWFILVSIRRKAFRGQLVASLICKNSAHRECYA